MTDALRYPNDTDTITASVKALRVKQPIGDIFIASMTHTLLARMTYFDVRRVLRDERDVERYLGIQRPLNESRVDQLKDYVNFFDATFPTSVIIAVDSEYAEFDEDTCILTFSNTRRGEEAPDSAFTNLCRVIDGQHRIAGLSGFRGKEFEVIVSIFVGSDIADQAYVFATVNLEQNKVNKSLALDLYELARTRSPFKTCHNIAVALDVTEDSPFFHRIKRLGTATVGRSGETLTQATFVQSLIPYISSNPRLDRDLLLRGKSLQFVSEDEERKLCFRNLFIREKDVVIGKIVEAYFRAVQNRWPTAWNSNTTGSILNRTNGFRALIRLLGDAYNLLVRPGNSVSAGQFKPLFDRVPAKSDYFTVDNFKPGSSGEAELRRYLAEHMFADVAGRLL